MVSGAHPLGGKLLPKCNRLDWFFDHRTELSPKGDIILGGFWETAEPLIGGRGGGAWREGLERG